jgi:hypothetical protein
MTPRTTVSGAAGWIFCAIETTMAPNTATASTAASASPSHLLIAALLSVVVVNDV